MVNPPWAERVARAALRQKTQETFAQVPESGELHPILLVPFSNRRSSLVIRPQRRRQLPDAQCVLHHGVRHRILREPSDFARFQGRHRQPIIE